MLSFVTITYSGDYPLLDLQARAMARFVDPEFVASISVVMNDTNEARLRKRVMPILASYGPLRDRVRLVCGDEILRPEGRETSRRRFERLYVDYRHRIPLVRRGGWRGNNGYRLQQALKLASARCAGSDHMVVLDAKNLFLRPVTEADFFGPDGRARIAFMAPQAEYHRNWLAESLRVLGLREGVADVDQTTTFSTPYPVNRAVMLGLLDEIDARYGSVQALFASRNRPSEFMLINAYCRKHFGGLGRWFEPAQPMNVGLWPDYSEEELAAELDCLDHPDALSLGLHNRLVPMLSPQQRQRVFSALQTRGICSADETMRVLGETERLSGNGSGIEDTLPA